jgi:hypothetical protein
MYQMHGKQGDESIGLRHIIKLRDIPARPLAASPLEVAAQGA